MAEFNTHSKIDVTKGAFVRDFLGNLVFYVEANGSPQEAYVGQTGRIKRVFYTNWADRWRFTQTVLGFSFVQTTGTVRWVSRLPPMPYKDVWVPNPVPGISPDEFPYWSWATSVDSIEGVGPRGNVDKNLVYVHEHAKITVSYESLSFKIRSDEEMVRRNFTRDAPITNTGLGLLGGALQVPDESTLTRYVTRMIQPTAEFLTLPYGFYHWVDEPPKDSPDLASANQGIIVPTTEVVYVWHQVPNYSVSRNTSGPGLDPYAGPPSNSLPSQVRSQMGTVNAQKFDFAEPGCMLLTSVESKPYRQVGGTHVADITYKMKFFTAIDFRNNQLYNPERGHNYFLRHDPNGKNPLATKSYQYQLLTNTGRADGQPVFRESDYTNLFRPDQPR